VKNIPQRLKGELSYFCRKIAQDRLTAAASGNISVRYNDNIYIKAKGVSFEEAGPQDFLRLDINNPDLKRLQPAPSFEYKFHIACYKSRPDIQAVLHTHPVFATTFYSAGIREKPITIEFVLYAGKSITAIPFLAPGSRRLAKAVGAGVKNHDAVVIKKHGLVTVGKSLQEAYLKALIIEREAKAQFICRLFRKEPPFLTKKDIALIMQEVHF
jgi:L-fuculose-phosphate aldolase